MAVHIQCFLTVKCLLFSQAIDIHNATFPFEIVAAYPVYDWVTITAGPTTLARMLGTTQAPKCGRY